jgi:acetyl esterase/lipase
LIKTKILLSFYTTICHNILPLPQEKQNQFSLLNLFYNLITKFHFMKKSLLLLFVCFLFATVAQAQTRYLDPVYTAAQIQRKDSVTYAVNKTLYYFYFAGALKSAPQAMLADIYSPPSADTATKRPLMIYLHTGNFLPLNYVGPNGGIKDSTAIEFCTRFARMGYVAASADYRLGWAPTLPTEELRRLTLINASYRGIQDVRSCIRFFKANAALYGIDTSKIILVGEGTGGYLSLGAATLDKFSKIPNTSYDANKFFYGGTTMVNESINGNIDGTTFGVVPQAIPDTTLLKRGDTLCIPNNPTLSSNFQMQVNLGGALGDATWIDANSKPSISFHVPYDFYAPYNDAVLYVGSATGPQPVIRVQGANWIQRRNDTLGVNNSFKTLVAARDPYKALFATRNGGTVQGLFPLFGKDTASDSAPWQFWSASNPKNAAGLLGAPSTTPARARLYIDTIMQIVLPRACIVLNLPCKGLVTSTEDLLNSNTTKLFASPNPAKTAITFESEIVNPMQAIQLFDLAGRQVMSVKVNAHNYTLQRNGLAAGMYVAKVKFEGGILTKKVVFED